MSVNYETLIKYSVGYAFPGGINLIHNLDNTWTVTDRHGFRLAKDGIFIGCPAPDRITAWTKDTKFTLDGAIEALSRCRGFPAQLVQSLRDGASTPAS